MRIAKKSMAVVVEADDEERQPPRPNNTGSGDEDEEDEEDEERIRGGLSLGDYWNFYLLLIFSGFALMLGQRMASGCDFIRRTPHYHFSAARGGRNSTTTSNATTTNFCQETYQYNRDFTTALDKQHDDDYNVVICETFFLQHDCGFRLWSGRSFNNFIKDADDQACFSYNMYIPSIGWVTPSFDHFFKASEFFSTLANIFGSFPFFIMIFILCFPVLVVIRGNNQQQEAEQGVKQPSIMNVLRWFFLVAWISQCLTFLIFASNLCSVGFSHEFLPNDTGNYTIPMMMDKVECSLGTGGHMSVAAAVLYFICFCMAPVAIPPPPITNFGSYHHYDNGHQQQVLEGEPANRPSRPPSLLPTTTIPREILSTGAPRDSHHHQGVHKEANHVTCQFE